VLKLELKEIRKQQDLLFRFLNFLKQEGAVHVLQFCLAVGKIQNTTLLVHWAPRLGFIIQSLHVAEEFNDKILSPELSNSELLRLHGEVVQIYETYCLDESIDKISFDPFIVDEIRNSKEQFSLLNSSATSRTSRENNHLDVQSGSKGSTQTNVLVSKF
ncbi:Sorting nexin-14, partial [Xenoophorus captivus]